ncbi:MAG: hypothetical protein V3U72_04885 [Candidatus Aenigmarchaeota archaeon]
MTDFKKKGVGEINPDVKDNQPDPPYIHYNGGKIPIAQYQKAGYEKLLKFLVKEVKL